MSRRRLVYRDFDISSPKLRGYFEYNAALFNRSTIAQMANDFYALLAALLANPDARLTEVDVVRTISRN